LKNDNDRYNQDRWLPVTKKEAERRGWNELDVVLFSGDAYVDHPSFGSAVIGRIIESCGLRIGVVPQPDWRGDFRDFKKFGVPRLFFAVTSGCMDSMINHYTAGKRLRSDDAYSPEGKAGLRPDYAAYVYIKILKELYPDVPVIAGGVEASLRRLTHYDYWSDSLKPAFPVESGADIVVYGMGEKPLLEIIKLLLKGVPFSALKTVENTAFIEDSVEALKKRNGWRDVNLHSHEECLADKKKFAENFVISERASVSEEPVRLIQKTGDRFLVVNPMFSSLTESDIDRGFDLPYTRLPHPKYKEKVIPAFEMIRHSVTAHRGCFGGCSFCAITAHQGKKIVSRSENSILREVKAVTEMPDFKGYVSDIGGPSANMYKMHGENESLCVKCLRASCLYPSLCGNLVFDHAPLIELYGKCEKVSGVKKLFISSGVRYDLLLCGEEAKRKKFFCSKYAERLITGHISGRLKVAPEHSSAGVLKLMRKPPYDLFVKFKKLFEKTSERAGLKQQIIPYFISSHPGSRLEDMAELAAETAGEGFRLEQVQDFTPTPMTLSTVIYYCGFDPYTGEKVFSAKSKKERDDQRGFFFWYKDEYRDRIKSLLRKIGREDLIKKLFYR
jgi:uncharacterized radical SAM protein YgiQ